MAIRSGLVELTDVDLLNMDLRAITTEIEVTTSDVLFQKYMRAPDTVAQ